MPVRRTKSAWSCILALGLVLTGLFAIAIFIPEAVSHNRGVQKLRAAEGEAAETKLQLTDMLAKLRAAEGEAAETKLQMTGMLAKLRAAEGETAETKLQMTGMLAKLRAAEGEAAETKLQMTGMLAKPPLTPKKEAQVAADDWHRQKQTTSPANAAESKATDTETRLQLPTAQPPLNMAFQISLNETKYSSIYFAAFQKGGTSSLYKLFPPRLQKRFNYGEPNGAALNYPILLNECGWGEAMARTRYRKPLQPTLRILILREPISRAISEWNYRRLPNVEAAGLTHAASDDTMETYTTRFAEHMSRHIGPRSERCYCATAPALCAGRPSKNPNQESGEWKDSFDCLYNLHEEDIVANADWLITNLVSEFHFVGILSRMDETMVFLWYLWKTKVDEAAILAAHPGSLAGWKFPSEPCSVVAINKNRHAPESAAVANTSRFVAPLNTNDLRLYNAVEALFEKQISWAKRHNSVLSKWLVKAARGELVKCPHWIHLKGQKPRIVYPSKTPSEGRHRSARA